MKPISTRALIAPMLNRIASTAPRLSDAEARDCTAIEAAARRPVTHRIDLVADRLPPPVSLAAKIAPGLPLGDKIHFNQRHPVGQLVPVAAWSWLLEFDAAMHEHGAYDWHDAVTSGALYLGDCHIWGPYYDAHRQIMRSIVNSTLCAVVLPSGKLSYWGDADGAFRPMSFDTDQDEWEPGLQTGPYGGPPQPYQKRFEHISWRDATLGLQLAGLVFAEMAAESAAERALEVD